MTKIARRLSDAIEGLEPPLRVVRTNGRWIAREDQSNPYVQYERRKAALPTTLSPGEFTKACMAIADELGI